MELSRPQLTVRAMMIGVASLAISLALIPSIPVVTQTYVWHGNLPIGMGVLNLHVIREPRLGFAFIPALSVIVALRKPARRVTWAAMGVDVFALLSWMLLRRPIVSPGAVLFWPDDVPRFLFDTSVRDCPSTFARLGPLFRVTTSGELVDLLTLGGLLIILISLVTRPLPRWLRVFVVLPTICYMFVSWASMMLSVRFWGHGDPPRVGLGRIPRASTMEFLQGPALFFVLLWLLSMLLLSIRRPMEL
jgi:hypothetical protein